MDAILPGFGPHGDATLADDWNQAHSLLSPYLPLGLLMPDEVCDAVEAAYRSGRMPINSVEGFFRQVLGWREFIRAPAGSDRSRSGRTFSSIIALCLRCLRGRLDLGCITFSG